MNAKDLTGGQELLCIRTEKVYDWIINEANFTDTVDTVIITPNICANIESVSCTVVPDPTTPFVEVSREDVQVVVDGALLTLQEVVIQKNFDLTITVDFTTGVTVTSPIQDVTRFERVILCAPEGTEIDVQYTDIDCFVTSFDCTPTDGPVTDVEVAFAVCQSIQVLFPVTLELIADFCQPRDILPTVCPTPFMPAQCPVLFPNGNGDNGTDD
ncbi:hypothetical protein ACQCVK_12050 [Rossellomorea vietnamensis]|uniref:Uncharacterized protein n=1 Tax=Rossellomorea aquimaris TaxID=189382 RepID=A0A5D4TFC6_9BACI|nr:hypothetical protein [Rossellomorea aquimaris]TYS74005.1 hypothetical protein FZC80_19325 [Rossellomorea aquimaris]